MFFPFTFSIEIYFFANFFSTKCYLMTDEKLVWILFVYLHKISCQVWQKWNWFVININWFVLWTNGNSWYRRADSLYWNLSDVVIEDKEWSAQDRMDYYDLTKSFYN